MVVHSNWVQKNPHPEQKRVGDCVKRACVLASEINYHDIAIMLNRYRKVTGASRFNSDWHWKKFILDVLNGVDLGNMQYINRGHRFTVHEYAKLRKNKAIVQCSKHLVAIDGKGHYLDTWDSGEKSIYKAFAIGDYDTIVEHIRQRHPKLCKGLTLERHKERGWL